MNQYIEGNGGLRSFFTASLSKTLDLKYKFVANMSNEHSDEVSSILAHHPVHILDAAGNKSPSAFIPFCQFGDSEIPLFGQNVEEFDIPVCKIFEMTVLEDQLCYKADIAEYLFNRTNEDFKTGFTILIDNNQDRQIISRKRKSYIVNKDKNNLSKCP